MMLDQKLGFQKEQAAKEMAIEWQRSYEEKVHAAFTSSLNATKLDNMALSIRGQYMLYYADNAWCFPRTPYVKFYPYDETCGNISKAEQQSTGEYIGTWSLGPDEFFSIARTVPQKELSHEECNLRIRGSSSYDICFIFFSRIT
jgi:hypothetical protein